MLGCGDTFLTGEEDEKLHLRIIVTAPNQLGEVVLVSVTTRRKRSERLTLLNVGDHPFIRHESVIAYNYSEIRTVDQIQTLIEAGLAKQREPVSEALLKRIGNGLRESDFTPNGVRQFFLATTEPQ